MDNIRDKLNGLNMAQLWSLTRKLNGATNTTGWDFGRDDRTKTKGALVPFLLGTYSDSTIRMFLAEMAAAVPVESPVAVPAPTRVSGVAAVDEDEERRKAIEILLGGGKGKLDEGRVRELAAEEAAKVLAVKPVIEMVIHGAPKVALPDDHHPLLPKVIALAAAGLNVLLKGPAGCGKTHLCETVAKTLGREFGAISGSAGASESQLTGRLLPTGDHGRFEYHPSVFVRNYEGGQCFLFDELDAFDPNMLLVANTALANGHFTVEARSDCPLVVRHKGTILLGAANTFGTGPDAMYVGRSQLDGATLDRWYVIEMTYDDSYEASLFGGNGKGVEAWKPSPAPTAAEIRKLGEWVVALREKCEASKVQRIVSTRMIHKAIAARHAGLSSAEIKADLLGGWTRDEIAKIGNLAVA
jgi:MoxR-like ATPase